VNLNKFRIIIIIGCIISLFFLTIYIFFFNINCVSVSDLLRNPNSKELTNLENSTICISGKPRIQKVSSDYLFVNICEGSSCFPAVLFNYNSIQKDLLEKNNLYNFTGKIKSYNNSYELIIYKFKDYDDCS
jgi:hypothetical protein